jgi:hypothetical protein
LIYKVYVADGREELVRGATISGITIKNFKHILGTSDGEIIVNDNYDGGTYIVPDGVLFEDVDITRNNDIHFNKPYIVQKP